MAQPFVVGVHFEQGNWSTPGLNRDVWEGVSAAARDLPDNPIEILLFQKRLDANGQVSLPSDLDLIIAAGSNQLRFAQAASVALPKTNILLIDAVLEAPNVNSVIFREYEVSYLLGYLAGTLTQTGTIGFIGEWQDPKTLANAMTFKQGVSAACSSCQVTSDYLEESDNPDKARLLAENQKAKGADIFFASAGNSSTGVVNYVNETLCMHVSTQRTSPLTPKLSSMSTSLSYTAKCQNAIPIFFIGNDNYQPETGDTDNNPLTLNHGLAAIRKRADRLAYQALLDSVNGRIGFGTRLVGLREGSIEIALNAYNRELIPEDLVNKLEELKAQIISGEIILNIPTLQ